MAENTDNLTLKLLQEMRGDMKDMKTEMREMRSDLNTRMDGITNVMMMIAAQGYTHGDRIDEFDSRLKKLEAKK